jgi:GNAT superfamily N-acetyltransferase
MKLRPLVLDAKRRNTRLALVIEQFTPGDVATFCGVTRIFLGAIEPSEQKSRADWEAIGSDQRYGAIIARTDSEIVGFSLAFFPSDRTFWLLEYMAVDEPWRGKGLGERLFEATMQLAHKRRPGTLGIVEVDRPPSLAPSKHAAHRRIAFYARVGCRKLVPLDYLLPLRTAGQPPPMMLLVAGAPATNSLSHEFVDSLLRTLYYEVYGIPNTDWRIESMLSQLPHRLELQSLA